jgi:hypothetical protein
MGYNPFGQMVRWPPLSVDHLPPAKRRVFSFTQYPPSPLGDGSERKPVTTKIIRDELLAWT